MQKSNYFRGILSLFIMCVFANFMNMGAHAVMFVWNLLYFSCLFYNIHRVIQQLIERLYIYSQATFSTRVWVLATDVMNLYEKAQLKGQKLNLATLISKPEFKQQYFAPIRSLNFDDQADLLSNVVSRELSLGELKIEVQERKR